MGAKRDVYWSTRVIWRRVRVHTSQLLWKRAWLAIALGVVIAACGGGGGGAPATSKPITIGILQMLTGSSGYYGKVFTNAALVRIDQINAAGGIKGRKVEAIVEDNASDDAATVTGMRKLGQNNDVLAILCPPYLPNLAAGQPVANQIGIVCITASGVEAPPGQPWSFKNTITYDDMLPKSIPDMLGALGAKKLGYIWDQQNAAHQVIHKFVTDLTPKAGVQIVADVPVNTSQPDYGSQIAKLAAAHPDVIGVGITTEDASRFMKQARDRGLQTQFLDFTEGLTNDRIFDLSKGAAVGLLGSSSVNIASAKMKDFESAYNAKFSSGFDPISSYAYDFMVLVELAMKKAASLDRTSIRDALNSLTSCEPCLHDYVNDGKHTFRVSVLYYLQMDSSGHFGTWSKKPSSGA